MKCKFCHAEIDQDSVFCPNCGKDLSQQSNHCIKCGATLDEGTEFCPYCGEHQSPQVQQSMQRTQNRPYNTPPKPMKTQKERKGSSGIWWLIPALLLACVAGYLLFFQSNDNKSRRLDDDRYEARDRDRDSRRDKEEDYQMKDSEKQQETEDSLYRVTKVRNDSLELIRDSLKNANNEKKAKQEKNHRSSKSGQSSSDNKERATVSTGTKNLGYATFKGSLKNGKPHDVNGRLIFKTSHIIDSRDPKGRVADPGDYVIGEFVDGHLIQGIWYGSDHQVKGSIIIGS